MDKIYTPQETIILPKEICQVPYSSEVNYSAFAGVFNDTSASYKMYWLLAILKEVASNKKELSLEH